MFGKRIWASGKSAVESSTIAVFSLVRFIAPTFASPARRIAPTITSSSSSLRRQSIAPAASSASSSRGLAEAVRQTTATSGYSFTSASVVSTPSIPGSRKSITTTSGRCSR